MTRRAESLAQRTAQAAQWRGATAVVSAISQLAIGVLLARLLTPADFGLMALAVVVLGLAQPLGDAGIGGAVTQRAELTGRHVRTAVTFSMVLGVAIAAIVALAAPLAAAVVGDARVTPVLRTLSIGFAVGGGGGVARALLRRELDFRRLFFIDTGSYVLGYGVVAATLALLGQGVWSLVWGGLCQAAVASGALLAVVHPVLRPLLARRELADLLHFGLGASAGAWVNYLALNGDNVVVGRWLGAADLGLYSRAYALMNLPYTFAAGVMSSVLFPAFAQVQADRARVGRAYLLVTKLTAMIAAPAMATLAIAAPHLVPSVYGPQWTGVVAPLQILCIAGYFRALYHLGGVVVQSVGWVYAEMWRQVAYAALVIVGAWAGSRLGLEGVAAAVCVAILYMFVATGQLALRATDIPARRYARVQIAPLVTAAIASGLALTTRFLLEAVRAPSPLITLAILGVAGMAWSAGLAWVLGDPELEPVRAQLPRSCVRIVEMCRGKFETSRT